MSNSNIIGYDCELFSFHIIDQIAFIKLKDRILYLGINLDLADKFFSLFSEIESSPAIKSILIVNSLGSLSENAYRKFLLEIDNQKLSKNIGNDDSINIKRHMNMLFRFILLISNFKKLIIIALQGEIATTFLGPALACDFRFASQDVQFKSSFLNFDIPPCGGLGYYLPKFIGRGRTIELLISSKPVNAVKAHKLGLVNEVISSKTFEKECLKKAIQFSALRLHAIKYARALLRTSTIELQKYLEHEMLLMERGYRNVTKSFNTEGCEN